MGTYEAISVPYGAERGGRAASYTFSSDGTFKYEVRSIEAAPGMENQTVITEGPSVDHEGFYKLDGRRLELEQTGVLPASAHRTIMLSEDLTSFECMGLLFSKRER